MTEPNETKAAEGEHNAKGVGSTDWLSEERLMEKPIDMWRREYVVQLEARKDRLTEEAMWWKANMPPSDEHGQRMVMAHHRMIGDTAEIIRKIKHAHMPPPPRSSDNEKLTQDARR